MRYGILLIGPALSAAMTKAVAQQDKASSINLDVLETQAVERLERIDEAMERLSEGRHDLANALTAFALRRNQEQGDRVTRAVFHAVKGAEISLKSLTAAE